MSSEANRARATSETNRTLEHFYGQLVKPTEHLWISKSYNSWTEDLNSDQVKFDIEKINNPFQPFNYPAPKTRNKSIQRFQKVQELFLINYTYMHKISNVNKYVYSFTHSQVLGSVEKCVSSFSLAGHINFTKQGETWYQIKTRCDS